MFQGLIYIKNSGYDIKDYVNYLSFFKLYIVYLKFKKTLIKALINLKLYVLEDI